MAYLLRILPQTWVGNLIGSIVVALIYSYGGSLLPDAGSLAHKVALGRSEPPRVCALGQTFKSARLMEQFLAYLTMDWPTFAIREPIGEFKAKCCALAAMVAAPVCTTPALAARRSSDQRRPPPAASRERRCGRLNSRAR